MKMTSIQHGNKGDLKVTSLTSFQGGFIGLCRSKTPSFYFQHPLFIIVFKPRLKDRQGGREGGLVLKSLSTACFNNAPGH